MIPLSALPIIIKRGIIIPRFLYPRHARLVMSIIELAEQFNGKNINEGYFKRILEGFVGDYKLSRALYYVLRYFYEFKAKRFEEIMPETVIKRLKINDEWEFKKLFFKWVNEKYGFLKREERIRAIEEFSNQYGLKPEDTLAILENELSENIIFIRKHTEKPKPLAIIGIYNFLLIEKLLSISEKAILNLYGIKLGETIKKLILRAKRHEVIADFKQIGAGIEIKITGPYQLFKLPAVSEYGKHIAATISPVIVNYEGWRLRLWVIYRKRKYYCEIRGHADNSPILKPYWIINAKEKPKETYDSSIEERVYRVLSQILSRVNAKILRESDVIILESGRIMIPDFTIVKDDKKVHLEVVGYWRKEYIEKKKEKFIEVMREGRNDLIVLIDEKIGKEFKEIRVPKILYSKDHIPIGKLYREILSMLNH